MHAPKQTVERARDLRRKMTLPEVVLWQAVRARRLDDIRFRRQHPVGPYILDFYCEDARLAVEVDGSGHEHPDQARHDARRTEWLNLHGVAVYRIAARDVLSNLEGVLTSLKHRVRNPPPSGACGGSYTSRPQGSERSVEMEGLAPDSGISGGPPPPLRGPPPPTGED